MLDCLCAGLAVADHLCIPVSRMPRAGELLLTERLELQTGGHAANVSTDLAKLGVRVGISARIGADLFGRFIRERLTQSGVQTEGLVETPGVDTSGTLIINVQGEDRRFIHAIGANGEFDGTEITTEQLKSIRVLYVGGLYALPKLSATAIRQLFQNARSAGVATILDVVIPGPADYLSTLREVLPWTDVFLPNNDEAEIITGQHDPHSQAKIFQQLGAKTTIITCGGAGTVVLSGTDRIRTQAFPVNFVDGTGSGDAFAAGYILGMLEGAETLRCLEIGSALGASCVRRTGASAGVFTRPELDEFLQVNHMVSTKIA
ncbi:MAG: sugar kinase, ribokinase [Planctomycetaceae bacterium]|nr:sugar kinase, ribokinase [Planctomycetaceae bacterium]